VYCFLNVRSHHNDVDGLVLNFNAKSKLGRNGQRYAEGKLDNLRFWVEDNGNYSIKGSIWKYSHGNNFGAFDQKKYDESVRELNSLTFGTFSSGLVIGLEFGFNIPTAHHPSVYIRQMSHSIVNGRSYHLNPLSNTKGKKQWGVSTLGVHSGYKAYSKTEESKLDHNVIRIEYYMRNVKAVLGKSLKVKDLNDSHFKKSLKNKLHAFIHNIHFKIDHDPSYLNRLNLVDKMRYLLICQVPHMTSKEVLDLLHCNRQTRCRESKNISRIIQSMNKQSGLSNDLIHAYNNVVMSL
jgi:hypothetical protein